jgi:hypothetical protein
VHVPPLLLLPPATDVVLEFEQAAARSDTPTSGKATLRNHFGIFPLRSS